MTKKFNLSPLINHFKNKDPKIASRLANFTQATSNLENLKRTAQVLINIANELDETAPALANQADALREQLVSSAGFDFQSGDKLMDKEGCGDMMHGAPGHKCMGPEDQETVVVVVEEPGMDMMSGDKLMDEDATTTDEVTVEELVEDHEPEIEDPKEPEPEFDMVALDDIREELENMRFRIADRPRREALESAIEHIEKAMDYHSAAKRRRDKVHEIFDSAGLALRLKDFD